jgi:hypothetical protein
VWGEEGGDGVWGGEITQTMYAYMNKRIKKVYCTHFTVEYFPVH